MNIQDWKELIHGLPCVVCFLQTGERRYGVHGHHLESVRDGLSDWLMVPLCPDCHQGPNGIHGLSRRAFYTRYKLDDLALMAGTIKLAMNTRTIREEGEITLRDAVITGLAQR